MINRRQWLVRGLGGAGAMFFAPGLAAGQMAAIAAGATTGFTHGVASGEPGPDRALLWTRWVNPRDGDTRLSAEVAATPDFARVVAGGEVLTGPWRDHTAKLFVGGLSPGRTYYYRFVAPDGGRSPTGRFRTLPAGRTDRFRIGVFSCSNIGFGWFNAYAHAVASDAIDVALHLGDYLYEYGPGGYDRAGFERVALIDPPHETLTLADYRLRYACYRADPDLQALHRAFAVIASPDDHELANDVWEGGAQNHQPDEGDWAMRKAAALQAWAEWMPVSDAAWARYPIGDLADLIRIDGRMQQRSRPTSLSAITGGVADEGALRAFAADRWHDPAATMLGSEQEMWLADAFRASVRRGARWQLMGSGTVLGRQIMPADSIGWLPADADAGWRASRANEVAAARIGLPYNLDNWGGYPAARSRLLRSARDAGAQLVALSGDSHNGWAHDLIDGGDAMGVEFCGQSVTSSGYEETVHGIDRTRVEAAFTGASEELRWCNIGDRGYMRVTMTPVAVENEWIVTDRIDTRSPAGRTAHRMRVRHGRNRLEDVAP